MQKIKTVLSENKSTRSLWRAVIMQAVIDATSNSKERHAKYHKKKAKDWLKKKDETFVETCLLAEMEPKYVEMKINKFFQKK